MAEGQSKVNFLQDVALPIFAFISAASGPYGAAGAQALTGALNVGQRRRSGQRREQRLEWIDIPNALFCPAPPPLSPWPPLSELRVACP
jgi:hypothetical protein